MCCPGGRRYVLRRRVVEWSNCGNNGVDGGVEVAVRCITFRCDQLRSLAMVFFIEFGVSQRGDMSLFKMSINRLYFPCCDWSRLSA